LSVSDGRQADDQCAQQMFGQAARDQGTSSLAYCPAMWQGFSLDK
jgi:hypothetical protein